jgi:hypothetical protein
MRNSVSSWSLGEDGEVLFCIPDVQIFHISSSVPNRIFFTSFFCFYTIFFQTRLNSCCPCGKLNIVVYSILWSIFVSTSSAESKPQKEFSWHSTTAHFYVWTNGKKRNISHLFPIGWNRRALYKWVCKLRLWDWGQFWLAESLFILI